MSGSITIGSTVLPNITNVSVALNDLDKDSSRNALGGLIRNRIAQIPEIKITFGIQDKTDMESLMALLTPASFSVTYYLPHTATSKTASFYAAPFKPSLILQDPDYYDALEITLIGYNGI